MEKNYKLLETEKYYYKYYEPSFPGDMAKILQIDKSTKNKKWVREIDVWEELDKAQLIDNFDFEVDDDYIG